VRALNPQSEIPNHQSKGGVMSDSAQPTAPPPPEASPAPPPAIEPSADAELWRQRAEAAECELALRRALGGVDWFDADDAYRELSTQAERDAAGGWRVAGKPLVDAVKDLAAKKPHWIRARVIGGSGAGGGTGTGAPQITYADLLKPEHRDKLREYLYEKPEELERLRQAHFKT
jgi:hypothetical protein